MEHCEDAGHDFTEKLEKVSLGTQNWSGAISASVGPAIYYTSSRKE